MKSVLIQFVWETFRWILTLKKKSDWAKYCWYLFRAVGESFTFSNWIFFCCHFLREISNDWILCMALLHAHPFGDKYWEEIYGKRDRLRRKIIWLDILASPSYPWYPGNDILVMISWQWYPGKSADGYKIWQKRSRGEFPAHFTHLFVQADTFVKSEKHLKPILRDQKMDPEILLSTWKNFFFHILFSCCL